MLCKECCLHKENECPIGIKTLKYCYWWDIREFKAGGHHWNHLQLPLNHREMAPLWYLKFPVTNSNVNCLIFFYNYSFRWYKLKSRLYRVGGGFLCVRVGGGMTNLVGKTKVMLRGTTGDTVSKSKIFSWFSRKQNGLGVYPKLKS